MILVCQNCRWQGRFEETVGGCCPVCFSKIPELNIFRLDYIN